MIDSAHFAGVIERAVKTAAALSKRAANHEFGESLVQSSLDELQHTIDELKAAKSELDEAQQLLNNSQSRFRKLEAIAPVAIIGVNLELSIVQWNSAAEDMFGWPAIAVTGQNFLTQCIPEEHRARVRQDLSAALDGAAKQFDAAIRTRNNQSRTIRWSAALLPAVQAQRDELAICGQDITDQLQADHQRLVVAEIQHRVKNNLAMVLAIADQTLAKSSSLDQFRDSFRARVIALAHMHTLLAERTTEGVPLHTLLTHVLEPYLAQGGPQARFNVQPILLTPKAGQSLSIALHELTTNAAKYGALTSPRGHIQVDVAVDQLSQPPLLKFVWTEKGGPAVALPRRRGLGTELVDQVIRFELRGHTAIHFDASGVRCEMAIPWSRTVGTIDENSSTLEAAVHSKPVSEMGALQGRRILLVEDTVLVANEIQRSLVDLGCEVIGPAATFEEALRLVRTQQYDAVLLDVDIEGEEAWPIADELLELRKPFVLTTGFACPSSLPPEFRSADYLEKPFNQRELAEKLLDVVSRASTRS